MKKINSIVYFVFAVSMVFPLCNYGQTFERNKKESSADFVKRILPEGTSLQFNVLETKLNSSEKKIIFFYKKLAMDSSINDTAKIACVFANILIPESETSNKYSLQTLKIDCNRAFNVTVEDATVEKDKQKKSFVNILFCQLTRKSNTLLIKSYKNFHLTQSSENNFLIEEVKE